MSKRLAATVYVHTAETGQSVRYDAGTLWNEKLGEAITNPAAWREVDDEAEVRAMAAQVASGQSVAEMQAELEALRARVATYEQGDGGGATTEEPPRNGPGSAEDAWRAYAVDIGAVDQESASTMSRTELIAAVDSRRQQ